MGLPLLLAADGPGREAVGRLDRHADDAVSTTRRSDQRDNAPTIASSLAAWDPWVGYFQLSRFKFVDDAAGVPAHLDLATEQQIMRVPNNRGACCHVAGDIDFDKHNNLWLVTGDDTPAGGGNSGGFGPFNDQLTDEAQTVRVTNATGGTFTLTFNGQTTAPLAFNLDRRRRSRPRSRRSATSATSGNAATRHRSGPSTRRTSPSRSDARSRRPTSRS